MENKEKLTKIIYKTLEALIEDIETKEDLDLLIYSLNDYESEGYSMKQFREKYSEKINYLKDRLYD